MFDCNVIITLWRRKFNPDSKKEEFTRVILPDLCKWSNITVKTATDKGALITQSVRVFIPYNPAYKLNCNVGDCVALGPQTVEITGVSPYTLSDVRNLLGQDFIQVKSVQDNTRSARFKHYVVEGV